jgi:hypothetical protein
MNERDRTDIWERTDTPKDRGTYTTGERTESYTSPSTHESSGYRSTSTRASDADVRGKSPEQLEEEIGRIRQEMNETLSAIESQFTPGQLIDRALHSMKGGPGAFASNLGTTLRDNPLPATLIGIGLGWLMMDERRPPRRSTYHPMSGETIGSRTEMAREKMSSGMEAARGKMDETKGRVSETTGRMKEKIGEMKHTVSEKMHSASDRMHHTREQSGERMHSMGERARHARERLSEKGHRTGERVHEMRSNVTGFAHEQPLLLSLIGLGVGALFAAMIPPTRKEDEWLGEASDRMKHQAKEAGREQMEKARHVASAAADTARQETERQLH